MLCSLLSAVSGSPIPPYPDKLENILKHYTDLSAEWLLTGNGDMIKENDVSSDDKDDYIIKLQKEKIEYMEKEISLLKKELSQLYNNSIPDETIKKLNG